MSSKAGGTPGKGGGKNNDNNNNLKPVLSKAEQRKAKKAAQKAARDGPDQPGPAGDSAVGTPEKASDAQQSEAQEVKTQSGPAGTAPVQPVKFKPGGAWGGFGDPRPSSQDPVAHSESSQKASDGREIGMGKKDGDPKAKGKDPIKSENLKESSKTVSRLTHDTRTPIFAAEYEKRPAFGNSGRAQDFTSNYVAMEIGNKENRNPNLFWYSIAVDKIQTAGQMEKEMTKEEDRNKNKNEPPGGDAGGQSAPASPRGKKLRQIIRIMVKLLADGNSFLNEDNVATDFSQILISTKRLAEKEMRFRVQYYSENHTAPRQNAPLYDVSLALAQTLTLSDLTNFVRSTGNLLGAGSVNHIVQALNILVGYPLKKDVNTVILGDNKMWTADPPSRLLKRGVQASRGLFTSVRPVSNRVLLNINVANAAFYQSQPLEVVVGELLKAGFDKDRLNRFLRGLRVSLKHLSDCEDLPAGNAPRTKREEDKCPRRIKTICGLAQQGDGTQLDRNKPSQVLFTGNPQEKGRFIGPKDVKFFQNDLGDHVTVYDYFLTTYNQVTNATYPVVNVGSAQDPQYAPVELCEIRPGQIYRTKLDGEQTADMIKFAVRKPSENRDHITGLGFSMLNITKDGRGNLGNFGVSLGNDLIRVTGRIIGTPAVKMRDQVAPYDGQWSHSKSKFPLVGSALVWSILVIRPPSNGDSTAGMKDSFRAKMQAHGISIGQCSSVATVNDPSLDNIERALKSINDKTLVLVILDQRDTMLYSRIKYAGDVLVGRHTVCALRHNILLKCDNLALKVNLKQGGTNHLVTPTNCGSILSDKTMIVGIDVTHPSPGSGKSAPSVAAVVANIDKDRGQWPVALSTQKGGQEMVDGLEEMMKSRLNLWKSPSLPENIIVYRDGVSEGQYSQVLDVELTAIREACIKKYRAQGRQWANLPKITIVIVGKRHHTRFYPVNNRKDAENPQPGLVVDRGVTDSRNWDFFLQAHRAIQGTARPAHYVVLMDEVFKRAYLDPQSRANALEAFTHGLCYTFGRATKAVSICTPAYYADIACERARCYLPSLAAAAPSATRGSAAAGGRMPDDGGAAEVGGNSVMPTVEIHPNLRDSMFYI